MELKENSKQQAINYFYKYFEEKLTKEDIEKIMFKPKDFRNGDWSIHKIKAQNIIKNKLIEV